jgi:hypothetical protein
MIVATFVAPIFVPLFFSLLARKARPTHEHPGEGGVPAAPAPAAPGPTTDGVAR